MPRSGPHSAGSTYSTWVTPPSPHGAPDVITPFIGFSSPLTSEKGKGRVGTRTQRPPPPVLPLETLRLLCAAVPHPCGVTGDMTHALGPWTQTFQKVSSRYLALILEAEERRRAQARRPAPSLLSSAPAALLQAQARGPTLPGQPLPLLWSPGSPGPCPPPTAVLGGAPASTAPLSTGPAETHAG